MVYAHILPAGCKQWLLKKAIIQYGFSCLSHLCIIFYSQFLVLSYSLTGESTHILNWQFAIPKVKFGKHYVPISDAFITVTPQFGPR